MPVADRAMFRAVLASVLTQQHLTIAAGVPRVQTAELAVARLAPGSDARSIVPAKAIDMVSSSDRLLVVFDRTRHLARILASRRCRVGPRISRSPSFGASLQERSD